MGFADGSNLYAYLHHKPTMMVDAYGLLGEAYRDFCKPEFSRNYFSNDDSPSFSSRLERPERDNSSSVFGNTQERAGYISHTFSQAAAGICHGGIDFITRQLCDLASIACCIGSYECSDSLEERLSFQAAYHDQQTGHMHAFNSFVGDCLGADPNHPVYQASRAYTTAGLEIGSLAIGAYGLAKGIAKVGSRSLVGGIKTAGKVAAKEVTSFTHGRVKFDLDVLSQAGRVMDRSGLTKAGRALQKHGGRPGSVFSKPNGNVTRMNELGQNVLDEILTHPDSAAHFRTHRQFGEIIDIKVPNVGGVRFKKNKEMIGLLEP